MLQLHELPDIELPELAKDGNGPTNATAVQKGGIGKGQTLDLPIGNPGWTALETLAEVSRQMGGPEKGKAKGKGKGGEKKVDQRGTVDLDAFDQAIDTLSGNGITEDMNVEGIANQDEGSRILSVSLHRFAIFWG